jgi:hypothetical protein
VAALRREQEMLREEAALQDAWFRDQVLDMLGQGWTRAELAETGFGEEFLEELGLLDHPALRAPGGSPARPLPAGMGAEAAGDGLPRSARHHSLRVAGATSLSGSPDGDAAQAP